MAYGSIKVDTIVFTNNSADQSVSISGIIASTSGNLTVTGTISGSTVQATYGTFTNLTGVTTTGTTANFVTLSGTTVTGTTANFITVSGTTITGGSGQFTSITGNTAGFTTVTGTTVTGTTANFVTVSGTTVTGTTANFTSGVFTNISGTTATFTSGIIASGTALLPSLAILLDPNTGIYSPGADQLAVATNGTSRLSIDANGSVAVDSNTLYVDAVNNRVGIGISTLAEKLEIQDGSISVGSSTNTSQANILVASYGYLLNGTKIGNASIRSSYNNGSNSAGLEFYVDANGSSTIERVRIRADGMFEVKGAGTAGSSPAFSVNGSAPANSAIIDTSGRFLVGTSTARSNLFNGGSASTPRVQFEANTNTWSNGLSVVNYSASGYGPTISLGLSLSNTQGTNTLTGNGEICGRILFLGNDGTNFLPAAQITTEIDGTSGANDMPGRLVFSTTADGAASPTAGLRILNNRQFDVYTNGGYGIWVATQRAASDSDHVFYATYGATGFQTGTVSFKVFTNGNVVNTNNSYGSISDIKLKENIVDANSQWDDLKALQVRNYNFKEGQTHTQIGLVAQEVELVSPGLVNESPDRDEDGNDLGTVTKSVNYSVLYMKAVKALQEAMERIEQLETEMAAVKAQLV